MGLEQNKNEVIESSNFVKKEKFNPLMFFVRIIQGALIGSGAIIPGVSGGVMCAAFGIYKPMMEFIAHPFKSFFKYIWLFIPVGIGGLLGFFGLANVVNLLFEYSEVIAQCLFAGLVAGTIPSLFKEAGKKGTTSGAFSGFTISMFAFFGIFIALKDTIHMSIQPNIWWYLFSGLLWGLSLIVPGLSSSSILVFMGLYEPMTEGVKNLDMSVVIPLFVGIAVTALLLARGVNYIFDKYHAIVSYLILGIVISSTLMIMPLRYNSLVEFLKGAAVFVVGYIIAWSMEKVGDKLNKE